MANTFYTAAQVASVAAVLAAKELLLGGLVYRDVESEFGEGSGATVKVRVPGAVPAHTRLPGDKATALLTDELTETTIDVTLTDHAYSAIVLSDADLSLDLVNYSRQVLAPQVRAVAAFAERAVLGAMQATPETISIVHDAAQPARTLTAIRTTLRSNGVPSDHDLVAVVGAGLYGQLLDGPIGTFDADGKVRGFTVVESSRLAADEAIGFIRDAFALAVRAPKVPDGAGFGASVSEPDSGFACRVVRHLDGSVLADRSIVSTFVGARAMPLALLNETAGTVSLVANGGAVRVLTAA